MVYCAVYGCSNRSGSRKKTPNVKFFSFPKNNDLASQWIQRCRREDKINLKTGVTCSVHFTERDYFKPLQQLLLKYSPKRCRKLSSSAIPSLHLPHTPVVENSLRTARVEQRARRKLAAELTKSTENVKDVTNEIQGDEFGTTTTINEMQIQDCEVDMVANLDMEIAHSGCQMDSDAFLDMEISHDGCQMDSDAFLDKISHVGCQTDSSANLDKKISCDEVDRVNQSSFNQEIILNSEIESLKSRIKTLDNLLQVEKSLKKHF